MSDQLMTKGDLARMLKRSVSAIDKDVQGRRLPFIRVGRLVRFEPEAISEFLRAHTVSPIGR